MKNLVVSLAFVFSFSNAFAVEDVHKVLFKNTLKITAQVNDKTVRCSDVGYGASELKINLQELKGKTIFDHSNARFGEFKEPCMTAGRCTAFGRRGFEIEDVIQGNPRQEQIAVIQTVSSSRELVADDAEGTKICVKTLFEDLETVIGGIKFHHRRQGEIERLPAEACAQ